MIPNLKIYDYITTEGTSLPIEVEKRIEELRKEYLEWVYAFGEGSCETKKVKEQLAIDGLSLWWLTLIAEKSPFKNDLMYKVFKLRTIELLVDESQSKKIHLLSGDEDLKAPLTKWAAERNIEFLWEKVGSKVSRPKSWKRRVYEGSPQLLQAFLWLFYLLWRRIRKVGKASPSEANRATFVTYFPNIDLDEAEKGRFRSRYWGQLHDLLVEMGIKVNWVLMYVDSKECSFDEALRLKDKFRKSSGDGFFLLEEFMTRSVLLGTLRDYLRLRSKGKALLRHDLFRLPASEINFYDIFKHDWESSVIGQVLFENMLWYRVFQKLFSVLPAQDFCLYLCEMIAWEKALCSVCKERSIFTIGYQHAALRLMDLRYFHHPPTYADASPYSLPLPDLLTVNGALSRGLLLKNGYPEKGLAMVEALRYLYLLDMEVKEHHPRTLLVVTGYTREENDLQLRILSQALPNLNFERVWIKPHPYTSIDETVKELGMATKVEVKSESISNLFAESDVVFTCNSTTASFESTYLGIPTISMMPEGIDLHPILGLGVPLVASPEDLIRFVKEPKPTPLGKDVLLLDRSLKLWREVLKSLRSKQYK